MDLLKEEGDGICEIKVVSPLYDDSSNTNNPTTA